MAESVRPSKDITELVALARRLTDQRQFDEAAELLRVAMRLDPKNLAAQLALAQLRRRQKDETGEPRSPAEQARERARRNAIDAAHFLGLAELYVERGEDFRAMECLEVARAKEPGNPGPELLAGHIHLRLKDFDSAAEHLRRACRLNPFDRDAAEQLGLVEYERRQFKEALTATIDAFLLLTDRDEVHGERLRRRIRTFRQALGWQNAPFTELFHERQEALRTAFDRLEWRRERFRQEVAWSDRRQAVTARIAPPLKSRLDLASRLRQIEVWGPLTDEQLFELARAAHLERHPKGSHILVHGSQGADIYAVESGEVAIERPTAYGTFQLARLGPGAVLGEVNFLTRGERSGDAVATQPTTILRLDAEGIEGAISASPDLGAQFYWALWHSLAKKLRLTNEQLRSFFAADNQPENFLRLRRERAPGDEVAVDSNDKIRLFREQGLSAKELVTLATFSRERRFGAGEVLFEEGDEGREMYIVLEGRVLISKMIPGAGEEALAILERGDFFGEMSLIDGQLRSADARAHGGPLTVLALDQATIHEMLTLDAQASLEFLRLLCRLVAKRLREIDEKVIGWRILSGERGAGTSSLTA